MNAEIRRGNVVSNDTINALPMVYVVIAESGHWLRNDIAKNAEKNIKPLYDIAI